MGEPNERARPRRFRRWAALIVVLGAMVAIAVATVLRDDGPSTDTTSRGSQTDRPEYRDDVRGFMIEHPKSWRVADNPTTAHLTGTFELVTLATVDLPAGDGRCDPLPIRALEALGTDGALVHIRASLPGQAELAFEEESIPGRPESLEGAAQPLGPRPECPPIDLDVRVWQKRFTQQGRVFDILVADGTQADQATLAEAWAVAESFQPAAAVEPSGDAAVDRPYLHTLYTHCGILGTRFNGAEWVADPPLHDGTGNPPRGWDNPFDIGTITLQPDGRAMFRSFGGRIAMFRVATEPDDRLSICE